MKLIKENKTTTAAIIVLLTGIGLTVALIVGKVDKDTYNSALIGLATFGTAIVGLLAADGKAKQ